MRVYPNPAKNWITITTRPQSDALEMALYDLNGRLIKKDSIASEMYTMNIEHLQNGMYLLVLSSENQKETLRIVKH